MSCNRVWLTLLLLMLVAPITMAQQPGASAPEERPAGGDAPKEERELPKPEDEESDDYEALMGRSLGEHAIEKSDIKYVEGEDAHARHVLDLYLPKDVKNFPVVFFVHGGSWYEGEKRHGKAIARGLLKHGYGVVSPNYRLVANPFEQANGIEFPAFVEDAAAALAWTSKNIASHGGNPKQIFLMGHSAGGHIASLLAADPSWLAKHDLKRADVIRGLVGISGAYVIPKVDDEDPQLRSMALMMSYAFPQDGETREKANPIGHVDFDTPPTLLLYAEREMFQLDKATVAMDRKLAEYGVLRQVKKIAERNHITILGRFGWRTDKAAEHVVEFLKAVRENNFNADPVPDGIEVKKRPATTAGETTGRPPQREGDPAKPGVGGGDTGKPAGEGHRTPAEKRDDERRKAGQPVGPKSGAGSPGGGKQSGPSGAAGTSHRAAA